MIDIVKWAGSKYGFYVDRSWSKRRKRWQLERGPIRLARYHARVLRHCFTPDRRGRLPYDRIGWCEPAKAGKTAIAALVAEFMSLHGDGDVVMASNKKDQAASLMFKSLTDSVEFNPHLPNVAPSKYEVAFASGNEVRAIPSRSRTEAGARFSLALFDELWGYVHEDSVRLWDGFKTDPTRQASLKMAIGYAGYDQEGQLWQDLLLEGLAGEPVPGLEDIGDGRGRPACWRNGRLFVFWSHACRQPWQSEEWIAEQRKALRPGEFARMIETDFSSVESAFCTAQMWDALVLPSYKCPEYGADVDLVCGVDIGIRSDHTAAVSLFRHKGSIWLGPYRITKPPKGGEVDLAGVLQGLLELSRNFRNVRFVLDPWQGIHLMQELKRRGIKAEEFAQTVSNLTRLGNALYDAVKEQRLVVYQGAQDLRQHVLSASVRESDRGLRLVKSGGGKIDGAIALGLALVSLEEQRPRGRMGTYRYA